MQNLQYELGGRVVTRASGQAVVEVEVRHYAAFRDRLLGQTIWQAVKRRNVADRAICHQRDLETDNALNIVRARSVGVLSTRLRQNL